MSQIQQQQFSTGPDKEPEYAEFPSAADEADIIGTLALSSRKRFLRRFKSNKGAMVAFGFLIFLLIIAVIGPWITPHDPNAQDLLNRLADPLTPNHLLGTDELGRDTFSRLIVATRVAMLAAGQAVIIGMVLGVPPGLIAGYFGGFVDLTIMRITDAVQSFPPLILAIAIVGILGPGLRNAMLAVGIIFAPNFLRIVQRRGVGGAGGDVHRGVSVDRDADGEDHPHPDLAERVAAVVGADLVGGRVRSARRGVAAASWGWGCSCRRRRGGRCWVAAISSCRGSRG